MSAPLGRQELFSNTVLGHAVQFSQNCVAYACHFEENNECRKVGTHKYLLIINRHARSRASKMSCTLHCMQCVRTCISLAHVHTSALKPFDATHGFVSILLLVTFHR